MMLAKNPFLKPIYSHKYLRSEHVKRPWFEIQNWGWWDLGCEDGGKARLKVILDVKMVARLDLKVILEGEKDLKPMRPWSYNGRM